MAGGMSKQSQTAHNKNCLVFSSSCCRSQCSARLRLHTHFRNWKCSVRIQKYIYISRCRPFVVLIVCVCEWESIKETSRWCWFWEKGTTKFRRWLYGRRSMPWRWWKKKKQMSPLGRKWPNYFIERTQIFAPFCAHSECMASWTSERQFHHVRSFSMFIMRALCHVYIGERELNNKVLTNKKRVCFVTAWQHQLPLLHIHQRHNIITSCFQQSTNIHSSDEAHNQILSLFSASNLLWIRQFKPSMPPCHGENMHGDLIKYLSVKGAQRMHPLNWWTALI